MKVVVKVLAATAMLCETCRAWKALAIMADAPEVAPTLVSKENVGAKVHGLSKTLKLPTSTRQCVQFHVTIYYNEYICILWDCLGRSQGAQERDTQHATAITSSMHKGANGKKQWPTRLGYCGRRIVNSVPVHLA
jgi:hypothetical protein